MTDFETWRAAVREQYGCDWLVFREPADTWRYDDLVEGYERGGWRAVLMQGLLQLGLEADQIRWHAEQRGRRWRGIVYEAS
ncbi:hypothetical protein GJW-30_1_03152 [Variibacter gotjawalensis]|uniref:Uncharacterized protein n=1 Tax=Variibacter gotjawalensis TaxID=1333996 RepID=A0A0S3PXD0_9BRAD|nr:hypothetical protein [Variibacter gotjawalensis]RZS48344.1 hypothetical protein EV661_0754 [Variibacter gotjawalensis]BAT60604.1 hypothetical protein GJW-30_1_03152 [Variibacter gotjawalensis]